MKKIDTKTDNMSMLSAAALRSRGRIYTKARKAIGIVGLRSKPRLPIMNIDRQIIIILEDSYLGKEKGDIK